METKTPVKFFARELVESMGNLESEQLDSRHAGQGLEESQRNRPVAFARRPPQVTLPHNANLQALPGRDNYCRS
jgi:hypothetical protein